MRPSYLGACKEAEKVLVNGKPVTGRTRFAAMVIASFATITAREVRNKAIELLLRTRTTP